MNPVPFKLHEDFGSVSTTGQRGWTLIEFVVIISIIGILAAVAIPRFVDTDKIRDRAFVDDIRSATRYAHKLAVTSGCDVQVDYNKNGAAPNVFELLMRNGCTGAGAFNVTIPNPAGNTDGAGGIFSDAGDYNLTAPNSISMDNNAVTGKYYFDRAGRPRKSSDDSLITSPITITVDTTLLTVENETGYIH